MVPLQRTDADGWADPYLPSPARRGRLLPGPPRRSRRQLGRPNKLAKRDVQCFEQPDEPREWNIDLARLNRLQLPCREAGALGQVFLGKAATAAPIAEVGGERLAEFAACTFLHPARRYRVGATQNTRCAACFVLSKAKMESGRNSLQFVWRLEIRDQ